MQENRPIDMQALRVFLATASDRNMSKAAVRLGISQSAVSQSLRLLEESFGTPLFNRAVRPLSLTEAGITLLNRGRLLLDDAMNLRGAVIEASRGIKPNLRIGLIDSFAATCGTPLVRQLLRSTAQLSLQCGLTPKLDEALVRRELDLVISSRSLDVDGMANQRVMTEKFLVIAPLVDAQPCSTLSDLAALSGSLPIVRFSQQSHLGEQVDNALRRVRLNPPHRLEVEAADTLTSMVAGGLGWAVTTPLCLLQGARSAVGVRQDFVPTLHAERSIYVHFRKEEYRSLGKEAFEMISAILEHQVNADLRAIDPSLPQLMQLHPWDDGS